MGDYNDRNCRHFQTRAAGQLQKGPLQAVGYDGSHIFGVTINEIDFNNSMEAQKYLDSRKSKFMDKNQLCKMRRAKLYSTQSD